MRSIFFTCICLGLSLGACGKNESSGENSPETFVFRRSSETSPELLAQRVREAASYSAEAAGSSLIAFLSQPAAAGLRASTLLACAEAETTYAFLRLACIAALGTTHPQESASAVERILHANDEAVVEAAAWAIYQNPFLMPELRLDDIMVLLAREELPQKMRFALWRAFRKAPDNMPKFFPTISLEKNSREIYPARNCGEFASYPEALICWAVEQNSGTRNWLLHAIPEPK